MSPRIELAPDAVGHPFAEMMAQLLRQNLDDHPEKQAVAMKLEGKVAIVVTDLDGDVTLDCHRGSITFHAGIQGIPDATIRAPSEWIAKMSLVELTPARYRIRIPDPRGPVSRELSDAEKRGIVRTHASPLATLLLLRMTEVLSIH